MYSPTGHNERVALVTGSAKRIGNAIAKILHEAGFRIAVHCNQSVEEAKIFVEVCNRIRTNSAQLFQADLSDQSAVKKLLKSVLLWSNRLDVLVNNASVFERSDCHSFSAQHWQNVFWLNVALPFELSLEAYPALKCQQGVIINITDIHAEKPLKGYSVYCQSKAALLMQTKSLARELAPLVRVNAVAPGAIAWPENENALSKEAQAKIIKKTPLRCHGDPGQVAEAVLLLVNNSFITGQVVNVDGGRSIV